MRLWLTSATAVSLRDQITRQVSLAILSGELRAGQKLPSVRTVGRRFHVHPNTVSAAYSQLQDEGLVLRRQGSGVYVKPALLGTAPPRQSRSAITLDESIANTIHTARQQGVSDNHLLDRVKTLLQRPATLALVEDDTHLIELVLFEIESAGRCKPDVCSPAEIWTPDSLTGKLKGRLAAVLPSRAQAMLQALGNPSAVHVLPINPIAASFAEHLPRSREHLVAVASDWPRFREAATTLLLSSGFAAEAIFVRVPAQPGWTAGLVEAAAVICDSLTRTRLPAGTRPLVYTLLSPTALESFPRQSTVTLHKSELVQPPTGA